MKRPGIRGAAVGSAVPRVVLVTRATEYELLVHRHATHAQAAFFLSNRGRCIGPVERSDQLFQKTRQAVLSAVPPKWRRSLVKRDDLDRFVFEPEDIIIALGQDGLVANLAKYLLGQIVIGVNPDPEQYDGVLVQQEPASVADLLRAVRSGRAAIEERTMVEASLDDGQRLTALNEIFVGHRSHQSARYRIGVEGRWERHSSSGLIAATGTGATGWAKSINRERAQPLPLPDPNEPSLAFFVREAFPSVSTGAEITAGRIGTSSALELVSELNEGGVIFGDGIETDYLGFGWGMTATIRVASQRLRLAH